MTPLPAQPHCTHPPPAWGKHSRTHPAELLGAFTALFPHGAFWGGFSSGKGQGSRAQMGHGEGLILGGEEQVRKTQKPRWDQQSPSTARGSIPAERRDRSAQHPGAASASTLCMFANGTTSKGRQGMCQRACPAPKQSPRRAGSPRDPSTAPASPAANPSGLNPKALHLKLCREQGWSRYKLSWEVLWCDS